LTSNHFFIKKSQVGGDSLCLEGPEHHHLSRVVRLQPHDEIWLFDEEGTKYQARIEDIGRQKTRLSLLEKTAAVPIGVRIRLGQALLKAKALEWIIQKATEVGIHSFIPVLTSRCVVRLEERSEKKVQRWNQIAREASKQFRSGIVPDILAPLPLDVFLRKTEADKKLFLSEHSGRPLKDVLRLAAEPPAAPLDVMILAGPEGGGTADEEKSVLGRGYEAVSVSKHVLRAETASLAAVAIIAHFWDRKYVSPRTKSR
jgi:16S rRNA (uracil1498-N3)-methyltransferase